jgi:hypothetical protein
MSLRNKRNATSNKLNSLISASTHVLKGEAAPNLFQIGTFPYWWLSIA